MDSERINRLVEQAHKAAADGIQGAMEAVDQALRNLHIPFPPTPPTPPVAPTVPFTAQEQADRENNPVETESGTAGEPHKTVNPEQEREAILRMIADGRVTPEEGDMLLEALGN